MEQTLEWNTGLYLAFVDFEKTFDSLDRKVLWMLLRDYGIPEKIVRMIRVFYDGFQAVEQAPLSDPSRTHAEGFCHITIMQNSPPSLPPGARLGISSSPW